MKERMSALLEALRPAKPPAEDEAEPPLSATIRALADAFLVGKSTYLYRRMGKLLSAAEKPAALGSLLHESLDECLLKSNTSVKDSSGFGHDLALVPATGDGVLVAQAPATELGEILKLIAEVLSQLEPVRALFLRWVLDGKVVVAGGDPHAADASQIAARLTGAADARAELMAAIRAVQLPKASEPFTLESAPFELIERLEHFLANDEFKLRPADAPVRYLAYFCFGLPLTPVSARSPATRRRRHCCRGQLTRCVRRSAASSSWRRRSSTPSSTRRACASTT
jgi:hypothetical protein